MFNLEQSIAEWRKQMLAAGIKTPVPLEELEIHLRDEVERQTKSGAGEQAAFEISVRQIGQPKMIDGEFKKSERMFMNQKTKIGASIIGLLAGAVVMTPGTIQLQRELVMADSKLGLWLIGWAMIGGSATFLQRMFLPGLFKVESKNVELSPMKQAAKIGAGTIVLLIALAFVMPSVAQGVHEGLVKFADICHLVFGIALLMTGAVVTFCPYKRRRA